MCRVACCRLILNRNEEFAAKDSTNRSAASPFLAKFMFFGILKIHISTFNSENRRQVYTVKKFFYCAREKRWYQFSSGGEKVPSNTNSIDFHVTTVANCSMRKRVLSVMQLSITIIQYGVNFFANVPFNQKRLQSDYRTRDALESLVEYSICCQFC